MNAQVAQIILTLIERAELKGKEVPMYNLAVSALQQIMVESQNPKEPKKDSKKK